MTRMGKQHFAAVALALVIATSHAAAQTTSELALKPWPDNYYGETLDKVLIQEKGHVKGSDDDAMAQVFFWDSKGRLRFDKDEPTPFSLGYRYLTMDFGNDDDAAEVPDTLDEVSLAASMHLGEVADGWDASLVVGAGYSGDNLFASEDGLFGIGHLLLKRQFDEHNALVVGVGYDGSSGLFPDVPYPEFAVVHTAGGDGDDLPVAFSLGYPYSSVRWGITERLVLDVSYAVPFSGEATLEYMIGKRWSVFGNYTNFFNAFYQQDERRENRIFYEVRRAEVGVRYQDPDVFKGIALDAALVVGYAFDQQFSTGWDVRDRAAAAELSDEPYVGIVVRGTF